MSKSATLVKPKAQTKASPKLPAYTEQEVLASLCRESFADFVKEFWDVLVPDRLVWNWHMDYLCNELQQIAERVFAGEEKLHDLLVNISPGTSKTMLASIMLPVWCWTRMPSMRVLTVSYAYTLASDISRKSRDLVKSDRFKACFPEILIREDQDSKSHYLTTAGGVRYAAGTGGTITGMHFHLIIVDDPIDPNAAGSDAELTKASIWMEETLPSRTTDRMITPVILIGQRLHEADPSASRLAKAESLPVKHICLPAELTVDVAPKECREFYVDGFMDPIRLGEKALAQAEAQGAFVYSSQYLQSPIPRGLQMFMVDTIQIQPAPRMVKTVRGWDKAGTSGGGAFTVGALMGVDAKGRYWILDIVRGQWNSGTRETIIKKTAGKDGRAVTIWVEEEGGSGGKESAEGTIRGLAGYRARAYKVGKSDGSKIDRADAMSSQVNIGNVFMVPAPWNAELLKEMRYFPRSKYKDQVDALSLCFNCLTVPKVTVGGRRAIEAQCSSN